MKRKLLSPIELKEFRLQQEEQKRIRAAELEKKNKKLTSPKDLLDPKPVVEVKEEPVVEEPKDPIEILRERVEKLASTIKEPKYYDEELAKLEVVLSTKVGIDEFNLEPVRLKIEELKESIPELPKVKYYDEELKDIQSQINELDIRHYDNDLEKITERLDELQVSGSEIFQQHGENLKELKKVTHQMLKDLDLLSKLEIPEAFDPSDIVNDIASTKESFYERIAELKKELSELPEVKYYDEELTTLRENIQSVKESIPEVPEIPEIKYYDDDLDKVIEMVEDVRQNIPELPEVKYYDNEIAALEEAINQVENKIPEIPDIPEVPEVKYYDDDIEVLSENLDKVRDGLIDIKLSIRAVEKSVTDVENREIPEAFDPTGLQIEIEKAFSEIEKLKEQPVTVKEDADPLLPLEQKFVTFEDLATHYRTFINRIQQQLSSLGGGGEVNLRYLDDIDRSSISDGKVLSYDAATKKFKFISPGAASSLWNEDGADIYRNSNVGINSADPQVALDVVGDVSVTGIVTVGTETITIDPTLNRITIDAPGGNQIIIDGNDELIRVGSGASIITLDANAQTVTVGSGSSAIVLNATQQTINVGVGITIDGDSNTIQIGSDTIDGNSGDAEFSGIVTAPTFVGEFVGNLDKTLEYQSGSLSTITTAQGTKTLFYDGAGILTGITGTGVYVSKEFTYDGGGNLISVNVL